MKHLFLLILIIVAVGFIIHWYNKHFKLPHLNAINLVTGAVKSGKTGTIVALGLKKYKKVKRQVKILNFFLKILNKPLEEEPLLYSNIPLACDYVPVTKELLNRIKRFRFRSVVILSEISFVADKMLYKYKDEKNEVLLCDNAKWFFKLFGHETHGGTLIADTQAISDCSAEFRRCISQQLFINGYSFTWLPFFAVCNCREERYAEDVNISNNYNEDIDKSMCKFLVRKKIQDYYDKFCYSLITDNLPIEDKVIHGKYLPHLKTNDVVSYVGIKQVGGLENDKKKV